MAPMSLDNGRRSREKLLRAVVARLLEPTASHLAISRGGAYGRVGRVEAFSRKAPDRRSPSSGRLRGLGLELSVFSTEAGADVRFDNFAAREP